MEKGDRVRVDNTARVGTIHCIINDPVVGIVYMVRFTDTHRGMYPADRLTVVDPLDIMMERISKEINTLSPEGLKKLERRGREAYNKMSTLRTNVLAYMITCNSICKEDLS